MFWVFSLSAAAAAAAQYAAAATHNRVGTYNVTHIVFSLGHLYVYREFRCLYSMVTLSLSVGIHFLFPSQPVSDCLFHLFSLALLFFTWNSHTKHFFANTKSELLQQYKKGKEARA